MDIYKKLALATVLAVCCASSLQAQVQNHLRPDTVTSQIHIPTSQSTAQPEPLNQQSLLQPQGSVQNQSTPNDEPSAPKTHHDNMVRGVDFEKHAQLINRLMDSPPSTSVREPAAHELIAEEFGQPLNERSPEPQEKKAVELIATQKNQAKLQEVAEKFLYSTMIVLSVGIGFIFVAKLFLKPKQAPKTNSKQQEFNVLSNMKLASKVNLFLIGVGEAKLVVATDPGGVKSVVRLSESFAETLGGLETEDNETISRSQSDTTYSLSSIGKSDSAPKQREPEVTPEDIIRRKMESALAEHGLKDLFLDSLRKG